MDGDGLAAAPCIPEGDAVRRLTCSRLGLAAKCLYWLRPDVPHEDVPSEARDVGTAFHALAAARINGHEAVAGILTAAGPEVLALYGAAFDHTAPATGKRAEVAYAFDPVTGNARELGVDIGRDYEKAGARPGEICGSADVVITIEPLLERWGLDGDELREVPGVIEVRDWKTGQDCGPAAASTQLRGLGSMSLLSQSRSYAVIVGYDYVSPDGVRSVSAPLDPFTLRDVIPLELTVLADAVAKDGPTSKPEPGEHCSSLYCPARHHCPAQRALVETAAPSHVKHLPLLQDATAAITRPEAARAILAALDALDDLSKIWWSKLDAYADEHGPIDVGGGKAYRGWNETRESIIVDDPAELALREHFGDAYKQTIERSVTKAAIDKLAAKVASPRGKSKMVEAALASLRVAGSVRSKVIRKHGVK